MTDQENQSTQEAQGAAPRSPEINDAFKKTLGNWVDERKNRPERNARNLVAEQIVAQKEMSPEEVKNKLAKTLERVDKALGDKEFLAIHRKDTQSGKEVVVRVRKQGEEYVAEEFHPVYNDDKSEVVEEQLISQAVIGPGGTRLTLTPRGEEYESADPHLVADDRFDEASATVFRILANSVVRGGTEIVGGHSATGERAKREELLGKEEFDKRRLEVRRRIELAEGDPDRDNEGALIFHGLEDAFRESVNDKSAAGKISGEARFGTYYITYKGARDALDKVDDPAEVNRAILSLRLFHDQLGLGEYKVEIDTKGTMSDEEKKNLIKEKIRQDIDAMPTLMARHLMADYVDHKANVGGLEERLKSKLPPGVYEKGIELADFPPRDLTRLDALSLQREADRVYWAEERLLGLTQNRDLKGEFYTLRRDRLSFTRENLTPLSARDEDERQNLINERTASFGRQLLESRGEKIAQAFEKLGDDQKRAKVEKLLESELAAEVAYRNLTSSLSSEDADRISEMLNEAKQARLKVKDALGEIRVSLAKQRGVNAIDELREAARKIALGQKQEPLWREVREALPAVKEVVAAKGSEIIAPAKKVVTEVIDKTLAAGEAASDALATGLGTIEEGLDATLGRAANWVGDRLKSTTDELQAEYKRLSPTSRERTKYWWRRQYYDKRHGIRVGLDKTLTAAKVQVEVRRRSARVIGRGLIGGVFGVLTEEDKAKLKEKRELLRKVASRPIESAKLVQVAKEGRTYAEKRKDAPEFQRFWKEVDEYVVDVSEQVEPPPKEPVTQEKFIADHPGMKGYEVVEYQFSGEKKVRANFWWDGEHVNWEFVRPDGSRMRKGASVEAKTVDEARTFIAGKVKEDLADKGAEYKRHMRFSVGEDGKLSLVEGKEDEFLLEEAEVKDVLQPSELREGAEYTEYIRIKDSNILYWVKDKKLYTEAVNAKGERIELTATTDVEDVSHAKRIINEDIDAYLKANPDVKEDDVERDVQVERPHESKINNKGESEYAKAVMADGTEGIIRYYWTKRLGEVRFKVVDDAGKELSKPQFVGKAETPEEARDLVDGSVLKNRSRGARVEFGVTLSQEVKTAAGEGEPEEPGTPEEAADVQLWKSINELKREKDKVKKDYEGKMGAGNARREDFDTYLDTIQPWEAALYGYNDFINSKLPPIERDDLKGNKDYEGYLRASRNLADLQRRIKEAQGVEEQEKLLTTYQNSIRAKWRIYKRLGAQGVIK